MISYRNINIQYHNNQILKNGCMDLEAGRLVLISGPSGSGKTALLYRLGLINPSCDIFFNHKRVRNIDRFRREKIAFVMQNNELISYLTVEENIREYAGIAGASISERKITRLLKKVNLNVPLDQKCSFLSLGERERLCIACALSKEADLIILDEPTASLDPYNKTIILDLIRRIASDGKLVVFSSHEINAGDYADDIYSLSSGKLICLKKSNQNLIEAKKYSHKTHLFRFIHSHIQSYNKQNRILQVITACFVLFTVICSSLVISGYQDYLDETRRVIFESSDRYLYITDNSNQGYADLDTEETHLLQGYPVYNIYALVADGITIVPYYSETNYKNKINSYLSSEKKGIYLSFRAAEKIRNEMPIQNNMELTFFDGKGTKTRTFPVNGILKQGVNSYELYDEETYISMWHEDYCALAEGYSIGRLLFYDNYEVLAQERDMFIKEGYKVNEKASSYEHVLEITADEELFFDHIKLILFAVSLMLLSSMDFCMIKRRLRELTILRMNGIPPLVISLMLIIEQVSAYIILIIFGIIISIVMDLIGIAYIISFVKCLSCFAFIQMVLFITNTYFLAVFDIEQVLRK